MCITQQLVGNEMALVCVTDPVCRGLSCELAVLGLQHVKLSCLNVHRGSYCCMCGPQHPP